MTPPADGRPRILFVDDDANLIAALRNVLHRDRKRWAWLLSVLWTLMPLLAIWLHHATGHVAAIGLPLRLHW